MKQARDYRKYNVHLTSADWQRGSGRVINDNSPFQLPVLNIYSSNRYSIELVYSSDLYEICHCPSRPL